jgi:hypothetical protein
MDYLQAAEAGGDAMLGSLQVSMAAPQTEAEAGG